MKTCDCCKHWEKDSDPAEKLGICKSPAIKFGVRRTNEETFDMRIVAEADSSAIDLDEAAVTDGSGYFGAFHPGPKFGCIHWQNKE